MSARIFQPARNAMQSGKVKSDMWILQFDATSPRSKEPLMGWTSSSDTCQQVKLRFETRQEAEDYAKREGLAYMVMESPKKTAAKGPQKSYADNFKFGRHANWTH
ncbi:MAG TPA: ETC complex I subunit [Devosia sp.]|nr:ETC complex I subunit [Devosia sp.]